MLTAGQIVTYALQAVKAPQYTTQAGDFLNARLATLARRYDFDVLLKAGTLNVTSGVQGYSAPSDYVRGKQFWYYIGGLPNEIDEMSLEQYNALNAGVLQMSYPTNWTSNPALSPAQIYLYPMPNTSFPLSFQYYSQPADISNPATSGIVPWFPDSVYLQTQLTADLMALTDDTRHAEFSARAEGMLKQFLEMQGDREGYARTVKKGQGFRNIFTKLPPSKITGF